VSKDYNDWKAEQNRQMCEFDAMRELARPKPKWTHEPPTAPGWYWTRMIDAVQNKWGEPYVRKVKDFGNGPYMDNARLEVVEWQQWWPEPIQEPESETTQKKKN